MSKFRFKSSKKEKFNLIDDNNELFNTEIISGVHTEIFSNKRIIIEGCHNIIEYQENYIKLKLKKGFLCVFGTCFLISAFEEQKIIIKGNINSIEFCF